MGYNDQPIISGVKLSLAPGDRIGLLGPNGAGKSTLIKLIAGELPPLKGKRKGQFAVYVKQPFRIVFQPYHDPIPKKEDGTIDLERVTRVLILEVVDYHG